LKNHYRTETDYLPINRWPQDERPREKLIRYGSNCLTNSELLAIMLRTGINTNSSSRSALDLAKALLSKFKSLNELLGASAAELTDIKGLGRAKAVQIIAALGLGKRAVSEKNGNNKSFKCSEEVANYYIPLLKDLKKSNSEFFFWI
jgi:DNA repair protein RadC